MKNVKKLILAGVVGMLVLGVLATAGLVAGVASAQTPTPPTTQSGTDLNQYFWQSLADRLGTTVDKLTQAFKDAAKDTVAKGLSEGQMTQSQADEANGRIDTWQPGQGGPWGMPFGGHDRGWGGMGHHGFGFEGQAILDAAAKTLGMTTADLTTELQSGKTLADIAAEKKVDVAALKQAMIDAAKAQVDQAVTDGKLTQAQADQLKTKIDTLAQNLDLSQPFMFGHHGFFGGPCPNMPGTTPTTPSGPGA
jgi:hypothetical protein